MYKCQNICIKSYTSVSSKPSKTHIYICVCVCVCVRVLQYVTLLESYFTKYIVKNVFSFTRIKLLNLSTNPYLLLVRLVSI